MDPEFKAEHEQLPHSQLPVEKLVKLLLKPNNVTLNPALSTVNNLTGQFGVLAALHAELESEPELEPQLYNPALEESNAELLLNKKHVRWLNAQSTVLWEIGLLGQLALFLVEKELKHALELLLPHQTKLERLVLPLENKMYANLNHAQLTAL